MEALWPVGSCYQPSMEDQGEMGQELGPGRGPPRFREPPVRQRYLWVRKLLSMNWLVLNTQDIEKGKKLSFD